MFLLSGAAALMYQVVWFRSLSLVFGGSHLAVTTILCVFMAGLALGSFLFGRFLIRRPGSLLRLYAFLEFGIALSGAMFMLLMKIYPSLFVFFAHLTGASSFHLTLIRVLFSFAALIVPTTLMGGTLPVLTAFAARSRDDLGSHLSYLYGINTVGAVLGACLAGFVLLPGSGLIAASLTAISVNVFIGIWSLHLQSRFDASSPAMSDIHGDKNPSSGVITNRFPFQFILFAVAISGFCALGYEILWTRVLIILLAATHYSFTIMLTAFLAGIGLGGAAYGLSLRIPLSRNSEAAPGRSVMQFGIVQILIGITNLVIMLFIFDLPSYSVLLQTALSRFGLDVFAVRQWSNFILAFSFLFAPAFFMGYAFPLAGRIRSYYNTAVGPAVGEVLSCNTVGAIAGAAISGYGMIYLLGLEKSLQALAALNVASGLFVLMTVRGGSFKRIALAAVLGLVLLVLVLNPTRLRLWDTRFFAIYRSNSPAAFSNPGIVQNRLSEMDIEYYAEGSESIVSAISYRKTGFKTFSTNGRVEASTGLQDVQNQYLLGHLPMLLHKHPQNILIVGAGSGMTVGATSAYPETQKISLIELEPVMMGVVKAFRAHNHDVLQDPRLNIVYNDGRNFLLTTREKFDIISSDPIHPWFRGAGALYTREYFRLAAERLNPGGVMSQWLPIYQLTPENLQSIVRTFSEQFRYIMLWLTISDAEMIGSNQPFMIDVRRLKQKMSVPAVARDLDRIFIRSWRDLLPYFLTGTEGARAFAVNGTVNTDDNMYLELSAPYSIGDISVEWRNVQGLTRHREPLFPYIVNGDYREDPQAVSLFDRAHQLYLANAGGSPEFAEVASELNIRYPRYSPWMALSSLSGSTRMK